MKKEYIYYVGFLVIGVALGGFVNFQPSLPRPENVNPPMPANNMKDNSMDMHDSASMPMDMNMDMSKSIPADKNMPEPTLSVTATPDTMGGFNIHAVTTNFKWTPELAGKVAEPNAGHAHIYVNGTKVGRMYSEWQYLGASYFKKGTNTIEVSLNANDHKDFYSKDGMHKIESRVEVEVK
jgi:hypothetical protein